MIPQTRQLTLLLILVGLMACQKSNMIIKKDEKGNIAEQYSITEDSLKQGEYIAYVDGVLYEKALYNRGQLQGKRLIYYPDGAVEIEENYDKDQIIGSYKTFFEDGTLAQEAQYINGVMQGPIKSYHPNGILKEVVTMVDNEENGPFKEYYEDGTLEWEGQYLNGDNEFGLLQHYNVEGVLDKKMMCDSQAICSTIWTLADGDVAPKTNN
jgi:antitoxin component YwqK of YwqJK toxin-antitoxin module